MKQLTLSTQLLYDQQCSTEKANKWYEKQPWLVGCNFLLSAAINQIEMWQS
jgi:hypothetical protein